MVFTAAIEPVSSGTATLLDYRHRPASGERPLLSNAAPGAERASGSADDGERSADHGRKEGILPQPARKGAAIFAAAVISGGLSPRPQSMEELVRRIGSSEIPPESQARLKDILA